KLAGLILLSTTFDYLIARGLDSATAARKRKALLICSIASNLGLLCYFKYANFFLQSLHDMLVILGVSSSLRLLDVIVPVVISFYTFEAISYTADVYRRRIRAERNLANLLFFITFFPHLIAGPIVRGRDFLPQVRRRKHWSWLRAQVGMQYLAMGLFKKLAIADRMAQFADPV